jgi:hypothetical protein
MIRGKRALLDGAPERFKPVQRRDKITDGDQNS